MADTMKTMEEEEIRSSPSNVSKKMNLNVLFLLFIEWLSKGPKAIEPPRSGVSKLSRKGRLWEQAFIPT